MATTQMVLVSSRELDKAHLRGTLASVAVDATVSELFQLPVGFGDFICERLVASIDTLSGAYVATAPAFDGMFLSIVDTNGTELVDIMLASRYVVGSTTSARPDLYVWADFNTPIFIKNRELVQVSSPIVAGAGVTGRVALRMTGPRLRQT